MYGGLRIGEKLTAANKVFMSMGQTRPLATIASGQMRLLSRIVFGDNFSYEKTFDGDINQSIKRLFKLFAIKDVKVTIHKNNISVTWTERQNKFQFLGTLTESEGQTKLKGEFLLGEYRTIMFLIWLSFWVVGIVFWEFGVIDFYRTGDDIGFLIFLVIGLIMILVFTSRANKKAKEIIATIDES